MSATMTAPARGGGPPGIDEYYRGGDDGDPEDHDKGGPKKPKEKWTISPFALILIVALLMIVWHLATRPSS